MCRANRISVQSRVTGSPVVGGEVISAPLCESLYRPSSDDYGPQFIVTAASQVQADRSECIDARDWTESPSLNKYETIAKEFTPFCVRVIYWVRKMHGLSKFAGGDNPIWSPKPRGPLTLLVYLHEAAHVELGHTNVPYFAYLQQTQPIQDWEYGPGVSRHRAEFDAEMLARKRLRDNHVYLDGYTKFKSWGYIDNMARCDIAAGCPSIDPTVATWIKTSTSSRALG